MSENIHHTSAAKQDLSSCHSCGRLQHMEVQKCGRCGGAIHLRRANSIERTWALLLASVILYIPANFFPVMTVISFGQGAPDTIMSGVIHLGEAGMWPLAGLVFFASIMVPVLKMIGIGFLLISIQLKLTWRAKDRTKLYRIIEMLGRWSMVDIFMISILVSLVKLGAIATIEPGAGATAFAGVVILTMLASMSFDPRLIWDVTEENNEYR